VKFFDERLIAIDDGQVSPPFGRPAGTGNARGEREERLGSMIIADSPNALHFALHSASIF